MTTIANSLYTSLKKHGFHNWGFLRVQDDEFDFNDLDTEYLEPINPDWYPTPTEH